MSETERAIVDAPPPAAGGEPAKENDRDAIDSTRAPLLEHLIELRRRLLWSVLALGAAFLLCLNFARPIFGILVQPLLEAGQGRLIYTQLFEAFFTEIKVALFAAFMIAFPIIASQIWLFVAPGLYAREKRAVLPFLFATPVLFAAGASMAYFVAVPLALKYLLSFSGNVGGVEQEAMPAVGNYLDFIMQFMFGFGVAFLLPVLLMVIERSGVVTLQQLRSARRYIIVAIVGVAALLTPPDAVSQLLLAVPLILLFEGSLLAIAVTGRSRAKKAEANAAK